MASLQEENLATTRRLAESTKRLLRLVEGDRHPHVEQVAQGGLRVGSAGHLGDMTGDGRVEVQPPCARQEGAVRPTTALAADIRMCSDDACIPCA